MLFKRLRSVLLPLALSLPLCAMAGPFSNLFVFGDSLSDTGNLIAAAGPGARSFPFVGPYDGGRFSNGPLWIEGLATGLGLASAAAPALLGGNNFAFAGARTGSSQNPPGLLAQAVGLWGGNDLSVNLSFADPNALYVVVGGGNDMRDVRSLNPGMGPLDVVAHGAGAAAAIANLANTLGYLANKGAKHILISTLPDLGNTPEAALLNSQAASSDASDQFNALTQTFLMGFGAGLGLHMNLLDMAGLIDELLANPASFGISNTSLPCFGFAFSAVDSCATSLFADILHPSAITHSLIAQAALDVLGVPEPDSLALFGLALLALVVVARRRAT